MTVRGGLQQTRLPAACQASRQSPRQPRSLALLRWHPAVRRCMRRSALTQADSETVAEEPAGEISNPSTLACIGQGGDQLDPSERGQNTADEPQPETFEDEDDGSGLTTQQVEAFLSILCEDTEIAELELEMGSFQMKVRRSLSGGIGASSAGSGAGGMMAPSVLSSQDLVGSLPSYSGPPPSPIATQSLPSFDEADESIVCIRSPKVGILRRGRYVKGKQIGKAPVVDVGDKVKKGQTVGYVEQLGTFVAVESPQAGEIASFIADEGQPVEYGEDVVELAPFFGGHIIGDSKYA